MAARVNAALRAKLENMAAENQQQLEDSTSEVPENHEIFVDGLPDGATHEQLSEHEVFVGDEDFYKRLADSVQATTTQKPVSLGWPLAAPIWLKRFSTIQKVLAVSIIAIAATLLYALLKSPSKPLPDIAAAPTPADEQIPTAQQAFSPESPVEDFAQAAPRQIQKPEPPLPPTQPLSLKVAETLYLKGNYNKAYAIYNQLRQSLPAGKEEQLLSDFLQLKKALCMKKANDPDQANRLFKTVSKSRSPVVSAVANYHLSFIEMRRKQYLKARTRAYQTIALTSAVIFNRDWALSLQRDCHFLVAESMTKNVLSLCDADKNLPPQLWNDSLEVDPLVNLSETQLRSFLNSGSERLSKALLGPQIQELDQAGTPSRWSVTCQGASIEELLARFAANAGLEIHWAFGGKPGPQESTNVARKRPVSLFLPAVTTSQFLTVASGCAGLLARLDDKGAVNISDPAHYSSLSEHLSLLTQQAISLWQRFILVFNDDERIANAHFALGLLQSQRSRPTEAIAEYKLVANQFSQTPLAPFALLHSSKLKSDLHDYSGAREDLKYLVEQYPDTDIAGQACLYLADATMKAEIYDEAARLYSKVYHLTLSSQSQTISALGAAKCFYERQRYEATAKWLTRYINLTKDRTGNNLHLAYFLLGKTNLALGKPEQACNALRYALAGQSSREEYIKTLSALVEGYIQQEQFVEAFDVLENIEPWNFSKRESIEILFLKSKVLRKTGLIDKAIATLGNRAEYISEPQLKARISFELSKCYIAKGSLGLARRNLTEILVFVEPGPLAHEIALKLADVCLELGQNPQTVSICLQLLDLAPSPPVKKKTLDLLATAYRRQKNYDKAALILLGRWNADETKNEKTALVSPASMEQSLNWTH